MSTVGLSFGSPTSGQGFDVSATVSSIVANLANVETPWKTQLSSLESQDTAISSLGTLFSTLSNDLSTLTDAEGVLAEKEGSSSDSNVLTLTAADSSAVAGTHTIEVSSLAQTSSGYLAPIASASATLSGSITLQAGSSGTPQTITLNSSDNTLAGLAAAINSSGAGIDASVLTDSSGSRLSLVSGTSGAGGNLIITSNTIVAANTALNYAGVAATSKANATGTLASISNAGDMLSGSISIQVGNGTAQTVTVGSSSNTLATLAAAINGTSGIGVTASVVTNSDGSSSLSLLSNTAGSAGNLSVSSSIVDTSNSLGYTSTTGGSDAQLTVDGAALTSSSNTVANLIPGVTFQLLSPSASGEQVQVVIANDNAGVESSIQTMVSDYNSLVSAMNTQEGETSSGSPEPLYGSPTLSLLQQQLLGSLNTANPAGSFDPIPSDLNTTLSGSITITGGFALDYTGTSGGGTASGSVGSIPGAADTLSGSISIQVGSGTAQTITVGSSSNTLATLATAINNAAIGVTASVVTSSGSSSLSLVSETPGAGGALTVDSSLFDTAPHTFTLDSTDNSLSGLASAINAANIGVSASVTTSGGESSLSLLSHTAGSNGVPVVDSNLVAQSATALTYGNTSPYTNTTADGGLIGGGPANDVLSGSVTVQVGRGTAATIQVPSSNATLAGLAAAIDNANLGVSATPVENANGSWSISLLSGTDGAAGALTITSNLLDQTNTTSQSLNYTNSSDVSSLTGLGISVNSDGSLSLDATSLDSLLNADYSGVIGFFQNANSWGMGFSNVLTNAGTGSPTGILALASTSNSNIESTLNADISKEQTSISTQQAKLTAELNSANEIMQELPSQLDGVNELYSAITGYNQNSNG